MNCRTVLRGGILIGAAAALGCHSGLRHEAEAHERSPHAVSPSQLFGRHLYVATEEFAVYASDERAATEFARVLDTELAAFRDCFPGVQTTKGIVVAIEPGDEPSPAVADWESRIADRASWDVESQPPSVARPYAFLREPYFRESFSLPRKKADELVCPKPDELPPGWICFLTTDPHFGERFDQAQTEIRQGLLKATKQIVLDLPPLEALTQTSVAAVAGLAEELLQARLRGIDRDLMHLQRRETLWTAWLTSGVGEASERQAALAALRAQIGAEWERTWDRRPRRPME